MVKINGSGNHHHHHSADLKASNGASGFDPHTYGMFFAILESHRDNIGAFTKYLDEITDRTVSDLSGMGNNSAKKLNLLECVLKAIVGITHNISDSNTPPTEDEVQAAILLPIFARNVVAIDQHFANDPTLLVYLNEIEKNVATIKAAAEHKTSSKKKESLGGNSQSN
jgi:hypothetical protein